MRAAVYHEPGGPEVLRVTEVPDVAPQPGQVVVSVAAAGLNPYDAKVRSGFIPSQAPFPRRIGMEMAGTVAAVGEDATYWTGQPAMVGDEVLGPGAGAVAEYAIASASALALRPAAVPAEVAAGLNTAGLTAVSCFRTVLIDSGDTVLVGGASGAVGLLVAQMAAQTGARVIGTASPRNHEYVHSLGAEPVAYGEGLADRVANMGQITAVIDCHGREAADAGVQLGVPVERIVAIAGYAAVEELGILNVEREARTAENLAGLVDEVAEERLVLPVAATFALDDVVEAFTMLEDSHKPGKIVVVP